MIEKTDAERIAAAIHALRPDWPAASVLTLIGKHYQHRPVRDIAVALTWIACDPNSRTPGRITEDGPWWTAAGAWKPGQQTEPTPATPRAHETCTVDGHSGWAGNCAQCRADLLAAVTSPEPAEPAIDPDAIDREVTYRRGAAAARQALAATHSEPEPKLEQTETNPMPTPDPMTRVRETPEQPAEVSA